MEFSDGSKYRVDVNFDIIDDFDLVGAVANAMEQHVRCFNLDIHKGLLSRAAQHAKELYERKMFTRRPSRLKFFPHILRNSRNK